MAMPPAMTPEIRSRLRQLGLNDDGRPLEESAPNRTAKQNEARTDMKTQTDRNMAARLERLETAQERSELLASRPDLMASAKTKAWLEDAPIATVRKACSLLARNDGQSSPSPDVSAADRERIRSRMRGGAQTINPSGRAIRVTGNKLEFLDITPEQARARVAEIERERNGSRKRRSA